MQLEVTGRNVEVTESIRTYAERKLGKLDKQLHADVPVELNLTAEKTPPSSAKQLPEATVHLKVEPLPAKAPAPDMKAAIDELAQKLVRQVKETHAKRSS